MSIINTLYPIFNTSKLIIMKRLILHFIFIFTLQLSFAQPAVVYHERTNNTVDDCENYTVDGKFNKCELNTGTGEDPIYVDNLAPDANEPVEIAFKIVDNFSSTTARVWYTTTGLDPEVKQGILGEPQPGTNVIDADYCCEFIDQVSPLVRGDIARATIPGLPAGTTVKYIVGAYTNNPRYASTSVLLNNSACVSDPNCCGTSDCATVYEYTVAGSLPVELTTFSVQQSKEEVILDWTTATEFNSSHFEIERSFDLEDWTFIGTVEAKGESQVEVDYSLIDEKPGLGKNYYRILQYDLDGRMEYSKVVSINLRTEKLISLFPNPVSSDLVNIKGNTNKLQSVEIEIFDYAGQLVQRNNLDLSYQNTLSIDQLENGIYFMKIFDENSFPIATEKLIRL